VGPRYHANGRYENIDDTNASSIPKSRLYYTILKFYLKTRISTKPTVSMLRKEIQALRPLNDPNIRCLSRKNNLFPVTYIWSRILTQRNHKLQLKKFARLLRWLLCLMMSCTRLPWHVIYKQALEAVTKMTAFEWKTTSCSWSDRLVYSLERTIWRASLCSNLSVRNFEK
jgi:hypothetical protein